MVMNSQLTIAEEAGEVSSLNLNVEAYSAVVGCFEGPVVGK